MHTLTVKDLAVPRNQYATISADSTLGQAVRRLQEAQEKERRVNPVRHRDRAILVVDENNEIIGKLSMLNVLHGLLPRYGKNRGSRTTSKGAMRVGSARAFIDSMERDAGLWKKPLVNVLEKGASLKVCDLIRPFLENEFIDEDASLDKALHQLITGRFQSLLVMRAGTIVGILRLTDIYDELSERLLAHEDAPAHHHETTS